VDRGHLLCHDGIADERRTIRLPRVASGLRRLVCIGSDGFVTLEALRWVSDVGASFVMLDKRGKVITVCSPTAPSDVRLRRSQSLALTNGTALNISKEIIRQKLEGQAAVVREMLNDPASADAISKFRAGLSNAESIDSVRLIESRGAKTYWGSWADVPVRWPTKDEQRVPEHWKRFGSRISSITGSPRLATTPPNALANLLYGLVESEARIAAVAMGMDAEIGMLHADTPNRSSLACDLQEPIRPKVDAFILDWLQTTPLCKADFWEDRQGNCRIASPLAIRLCQTAKTWRGLVAPVAEWVAQALWAAAQTVNRKYLVPTRLTQRRRSEGRGNDLVVHATRVPRQVKICEVCGAEGVQNRYCRSCAVDASRDNMARAALIGHARPRAADARARISNTLGDHAVAISWWSPSSLPTWLNEECYAQKILPRLKAIKVREIAEALAVSQPYAAQIRAGKRRAHPRHWQALARLVCVGGGSTVSQ
jgi:CRISPR-associated protein Cas1